MYCPQCRSELPDDAKYCIKCAYDFTKIKTPPEKKNHQDSLDASGTLIQKESEIESFKVGSLFANRYEILSEGLKGGMGAVYKCKDTKLDEIVALKVIHPRLLSSSQALSRFRQEVSISRKLQHPNIVRVYNLEEWDGKEYFTMEWVDGMTLREIITKRRKENRPFCVEEAYQIISQLSDALQHAHQFTIHRDIKPENILVPEGKQLTVKLTDFGIAKMLSPSQFTSTSIQMGTPYYMAPEQKTDSARVDKRADIYALGVVLFELLTLENTIGFELPSEINKILPKEIDNIIKKALATKADDRYGDAKELSDALNKVADIFSEQTERHRKEAEEQKKREREKLQREAEERKQKEADQKKREEEEKKRQELEKREEAESERREARRTKAEEQTGIDEEQQRKIGQEEKRRETEEKAISRKKAFIAAMVIGFIIVVFIYSWQFKTPSQVAIPQPTPESPLRSETPTAAPSLPTGIIAQKSIAPTEALGFIQAYCKATREGDLTSVLGYYADSVDYYGKGRVNKDFIRKDKEYYFKRWSTIENAVEGEVNLSDTANQDIKIVKFITSFRVRNSSKAIKGRAENTWKLKKINDQLQIIDEKQTVLGREAM
jgi:serine/threonine protein kinase